MIVYLQYELAEYSGIYYRCGCLYVAAQGYRAGLSRSEILEVQ